VKKTGYRQQRVQKDIHRLLGTLIHDELHDRRIIKAEPVISSVSVARDFSFVRVYLTFMSPDLTENDRKEVFRILEASSGYFRSCIGKTLKLRLAPVIVFEYNDFHEQMKAAEEVLQEEKAELEQITGNPIV
jgi:ribosome-binding factor A